MNKIIESKMKMEKDGKMVSNKITVEFNFEGMKLVAYVNRNKTMRIEREMKNDVLGELFLIEKGLKETEQLSILRKIKYELLQQWAEKYPQQYGLAGVSKGEEYCKLLLQRKASKEAISINIPMKYTSSLSIDLGEYFDTSKVAIKTNSIWGRYGEEDKETLSISYSITPDILVREQRLVEVEICGVYIRSCFYFSYGKFCKQVVDYVNKNGRFDREYPKDFIEGFVLDNLQDFLNKYENTYKINIKSRRHELLVENSEILNSGFYISVTGPFKNEEYILKVHGYVKGYEGTVFTFNTKTPEKYLGVKTYQSEKYVYRDVKEMYLTKKGKSLVYSMFNELDIDIDVSDLKQEETLGDKIEFLYNVCANIFKTNEKFIIAFKYKVGENEIAQARKEFPLKTGIEEAYNFIKTTSDYKIV